MAFNCDFNAPMYVDFENLEGDGNADDFFDTHLEDEPLSKDGESKPSSAPTRKMPLRATRSIGGGAPLKPVNRSEAANTSVDHLRPKTSASSSLKTINKSATHNKHITKEQADLMVQRLCPQGLSKKLHPKFESLAERTNKYFGTPERFRRTRSIKPRSSSADAHLRKRSPSPASSIAAKKAIFVTDPQSPRLLTRGRTRCNHQVENESGAKKSTAESRLASLKRRVCSAINQPSIKHTATSKMREEKAKTSSTVTIKEPLKTVMHNGIPIFLQNKQKQAEGAAEAKKPLPPVPANSVHIKLYEKDKEIKAKLEREREKEIERERQMALFKAKEATVLSKKPFLPKQCDKDPVRPIFSHLHTEQRSEERRLFDQRMKEKEAELEAARQQEMEKRQQDEEQELNKQRQATVHKAAPIRAYPNIAVQPSDKPLTQPKTPNFKLRRSRHKSS